MIKSILFNLQAILCHGIRKWWRSNVPNPKSAQI